MADENTDTAAVDDAKPEAAFGSGFEGVEDKADTKPLANGKANPARDAAQEEVEPPPEVVQITKKEWEEVRAAAAASASHEKQFRRAWGTIGQLQTAINGLPKPQDAPPAARKVEISKAAFAEMEKDFPELAQQTRAALEAALSGLPSTNGAEVDATKIEGMLAQYTARREIEALEDAYPEWRTIVGAVDVSRETPDPNNPFRKWLSGKPDDYQARINGSESAAVIGRAIRLFQRETAALTKPAATPRDTARADRIRAAVQPRGDNAGAAPSNTAEQAFESGFTGR